MGASNVKMHTRTVEELKQPSAPVGERSSAVLITGCSSGIGRSTAEHLAAAGWPVYASARDISSIADLETKGCHLLALDVTDHQSMTAAVAAVEAAEGAVGVLVNNAGFGLHGAIETTPIEDARVQFETNFFGLARLIQLVLPGMRRQGWGKVVNVSSMGGKFTLPGGGFYHASKHAVEALSDALRLEVAPFGINVIVIEPGVVGTSFGDAAVATVSSTEVDDSPYALFNQKVMLKINGAYRRRTVGGPASPASVARVIKRAISAPRPRIRYPVTIGGRILMAARRFLPDRVFDALVARSYSL
jgi:NAD(P)-dependent dehydrogenase (short-subunit alcohol dehydrogenase family)